MAAFGSTLAVDRGQDVLLWDAAAGARTAVRGAAAGPRVTSLALAAPHLLLAGGGRGVRLWRRGGSRGDWTCVRTMQGTTAPQRWMSAADGLVASSSLSDGGATLHDMYSGGVAAILRPHAAGARLTALHLSGSEDGGALATAASDGSVVLSDIGTGLPTMRFRSQMLEGVPAVDVLHQAPSQHRVTVGWWDGACCFDTRRPGDPLWFAHCGLSRRRVRMRHSSQPWLADFWTLCVPPVGGACLAVSRHALRALDAGTGEQLAVVRRDCTLASDAGSRSTASPSAAAGGGGPPQPGRAPGGARVQAPCRRGAGLNVVVARVRQAWLRWPGRVPDRRLESGCHVDGCDALLHQPICAAAVAGRLAVGTARSVALLQFPACDAVS